MTYQNTQPHSGPLHEVSTNPGPGAGAGADDGMDGGIAGSVAGSGRMTSTDQYPHTISANRDGAGADTHPEGFRDRGYVHDGPNASPTVSDASTGRVRNI